MEVGLILLLEDTSAPENDFALALNLRFSESTDIVRIAVGCLHLFIYSLLRLNSRDCEDKAHSGTNTRLMLGVQWLSGF